MQQKSHFDRVLITIAYCKSNNNQEADLVHAYNQIVKASQGNDYIYVGNIYGIAGVVEDIEKAISEIMQQQELIQKSNPNIRQLLLILENKMSEETKQNNMESFCFSKSISKNMDKFVNEKARERCKIYLEGRNFYENQKINELNPLNHTYRTMLPVKDSIVIRKKLERVDIDIAEAKEFYEDNKLINYFYYLALQEGLARSIYVLTIGTDSRDLREEQIGDILIKCIYDMVELLKYY